MAVWLGEQVAKLIEQPPKIKINPNGVDIGISEIWKIPEDRKSQAPAQEVSLFQAHGV